jgi:hypothetical protein
VITEKTVELNLTAELLNWLYGITKRTHYVIAPSQQQEGKLGFDAGFYGSGPGLFIQFKRAWVKKSVWTWRLNRTAEEDQHERLQILESLGVPVFYAFPQFSTTQELVQWRRQLLTHTLWVRPRELRPPGGPTGPHDLLFDAASGSWQLSSPEPLSIEQPGIPLEAVVSTFRREWREGQLTEFLDLVNMMLFSSEAPVQSPVEPPDSLEPDSTLASGFVLIGASTETPEADAHMR